MILPLNLLLFSIHIDNASVQICPATDEQEPVRIPILKWSLAVVLAVAIALLPLQYLIRFGAQRGRATTEPWLISTCSVVVLGFIFYEVQ
jgi:hypothetical protein